MKLRGKDSMSLASLIAAERFVFSETEEETQRRRMERCICVFDEGRAKMRRLVGLGALLALTGVVIVAAPSAGAYGNTAVYQITFSLNCTSPAPGACDQFGGPGGVWGWIELDSSSAGNTGDMTLTVCGHSPGGGGGGAAHENVEITNWSISGGFISLDGTDPGVPPFVSGTALGIPAAAGHYSEHPFPGLAAEITVVRIPNR